MGTISYSEIATFQRCKKLWDYSYLQGWVPNWKDEGLSRGYIMHELLAENYRNLGFWRGRWEELRDEALAASLLEEETEKILLDFELYATIMGRYQDQYRESGFEVYRDKDGPFVEREVLIPIGPTFELAGGIIGDSLKAKIDVLICRPDGTELKLVDHKTVTDFDKNMATQADYDLQLSMYLLGLRRLGLPVEAAVHNFIRMRIPAVPKLNKDGTMSKVYVITDEATVRDFVRMTGAKISDSELETYIAKLPEDAFFRRIETIRTDDELLYIEKEVVAKLEERNKEEVGDGYLPHTRTLIKECVRCPFFKPCMAGLKGGDEELVLNEMYHKKEETHESTGIADDEAWGPSL